MRLSLPLGIDDFAKIRENNFYYIDKTVLIKHILSEQFEANLITRPRRFGKSLNMSMLEDFFDISRNSKAHFDGLEISKETTTGYLFIHLSQSVVSLDISSPSK